MSDPHATLLTVPRSDDQELAAFLADRDVACPLCGYNLRGLAGPRCPECGRELRLTVGLTEPAMRAWITLAVGVFASSGIGMLFLLLILHLGWPPSMHGLGSTALLYFILSPVLLFPTLNGRRRFLRLTPARQWRIALAMACLTVFAIIAFAVDIR